MTAGVVYAILAALLLAYAMRLLAADAKDRRAKKAAAEAARLAILAKETELG